MARAVDTLLYRSRWNKRPAGVAEWTFRITFMSKESRMALHKLAGRDEIQLVTGHGGIEAVTVHFNAVDYRTATRILRVALVNDGNAIIEPQP